MTDTIVLTCTRCGTEVLVDRRHHDNLAPFGAWTCPTCKREDER